MVKDSNNEQPTINYIKLPSQPYIYNESINYCSLKLNIETERNKFFNDFKPTIYKVNQYVSAKQKRLYVFVGETPPSLVPIFDKISKNLKKNHEIDQKKLLDQEITILKHEYGVDFSKVLGLNIQNIISITFIPLLIFAEDTIQNIIEKIILYINKDYDINRIFIWVDLLDSIYLNSKKYFFYSRFRKKSNVLYPTELLETIKNLTNNSNLTLEDLGMNDNNVINLNDLDNINILSVNKLMKFNIENILYNYDNNLGNLSFNNPFEDKCLVDSNMQDILGNLLDKKKKIMLDYDNFSANLINLVFYDDFEKNCSFINKTILPQYIKKYWPNLKINNYSSEFIKNQTKKMNFKNQILNYIFTNNEKKNNIYLESYNYFTTTVKINNNYNVYNRSLDNNYINLDFIFKNFQVSFNVPFMKYKSDNFSEAKIKFFYMVTLNSNMFWVDKNTILNWGIGNKKKNSFLDENNLISKGIQFKLFISKRESKNEFAHINISREGKIDLNLYAKDKDKYCLANIKIAIKKCSNLISQINNLLKYDISPYKKNITLPNDKLESVNNINTHIASLNLKLTLKTDQDLSIEKIKNLLEKFPFLVRIIDENLSDTIKMWYLKISNFENNNEIYTYLSSYLSNGYPNSELLVLDKMQEKFNINEEEASSILNKWKSDQEQKKNLSHFKKDFQKYTNLNNNGIYIVIKKEIPQIFSIKIQGIKNIKQVPFINNFVKTLFLLILNNIKINTNLSNDYEYDDNSNDNLFNDDLEIYNDMEDYYDDSDYNISDNDLSYDADDNDKSLNNLDQSEIDLSNENTFNNNNKINNKIINESLEDKKLDTDENIQSNNYAPEKLRNFNVNRLQKYDPELFDFSDQQNRGYSSQCQNVQNKQPIVLNKQQKERIEKEFPDSIPGGIQPFRKINGKITTKDIPEQRYYICPFIWCIKDEVSLSPNDLVINKYGDRSCPICGGINVNSKNIYSKNIPKTLLLRDKSWDQLWQTYKDPTRDIWDSDFVLKNKWKNMYPGFIDSCLPCCQKKHSENFIKKQKKCIEGDTNKTEDNVHRYIKDSYKLLEKGKKGVLPTDLNTIFQNDLSEMFPNKKTSGLLNNNVSCYLRYGVNEIEYNNINNSILLNNTNSFIYCVMESVKKFLKYSDDSKSEKEITYEDLIDYLCIKLTPEIFIKLNLGDLVLIFTENINTSNFSKYFLSLNKDIYNEEDYYLYYEFEEFIKWCKTNEKFIKKIYDAEFILSENFTLNQYFAYKFDNHSNLQRCNIVDRIYQIYKGLSSFINYLKSNFFKDPVILSEYLGYNNILQKNGFLIVIFNYIKENITLSCPMWQNKELLKYNDKKILCILKQEKQNKEYYEPIYNFTWLKSKNHFVVKPFIGDDNKENKYIMDLIIKQLNTCSIKRNKVYEEFYKVNNYIFSKSSTEIIILLNKFKNKMGDWPNGNFTPLYQIVNNKFKSIGFIIPSLSSSKDDIIDNSLDNKVLLPFDPSEIVDNIPIIFDISYYKPNTYEETSETLKYLTEKFSIENSLNLEPLENILNIKGEVNFINIVTNNLVPVIPKKINNGLKNIVREIHIDMELQTNYHKEIIDIREILNIRNQFEKDSYNQFRYEIANYLNLNSNLINNDKTIFKNDIVIYKNKKYQVYRLRKNKNADLKSLDDDSKLLNIPLSLLELKTILNPNNKILIKSFIIKIIESKYLSDFYKFDILKNLFVTLENKNYNDIMKKYGIIIKKPIFKQISVFEDNSKKKELMYKNFKLTRKSCKYYNDLDYCDSQSNCIWDNNRCKLFINKSNLLDNKINNEDNYTNLIIEDLIKNNFKRDEILNNKININSFSSISDNKYTIVVNENNFIDKINDLYNLNKFYYIGSQFSPIDVDNYNIINNSHYNYDISLEYKWSIILDDYDFTLKKYNSENINLSIELLFEKNINILKNNLIDIYKKYSFLDIISKYYNYTNINLSFITSVKLFNDYLLNNHILNLNDIKELIKFYKKNVIILNDNNMTIDSYKYNDTENFNILLNIFNQQNYSSLFLLIYKNESYTFAYNTFSNQFKNFIKKKNNNIESIQVKN